MERSLFSRYTNLGGIRELKTHVVLAYETKFKKVNQSYHYLLNICSFVKQIEVKNVNALERMIALER